MSIVIGIVAHESRAAAAAKLRQSVGAVVVNRDDGTLGCEGNHIVVLRQLAARHNDWCVVLEDDAIPVRDFRVHVKAALACAPAAIVGLYLGTGNPSGVPGRAVGEAVRTALKKDRAWITGDCLIGSVGYAVRVRLITAMLAGITGRVGEELPLRISRWAQETGMTVAYTQPSLVNHLDGVPIGFSEAEFAALRGTAGAERKAWSFGVRKDWDTPAVALGNCGIWSAT